MEDKRVRAFLALSKLTGQSLTAEFVRHTGRQFPEAELATLHNFYEGIFKPARDPYALCIWSRSALGAEPEEYPDEFFPLAEGTWILKYAAKKGSLEIAANRSLMNCLRDKIPVLVIVTERPDGLQKHKRYRFLGPALIEDFDPATRRFSLRGASQMVADQIVDTARTEDQLILGLRNGVVLPFQVHEERAEYMVRRDVREAAFRRVVLEQYNFFCAVCDSKFLLRDQKSGFVTEAEAGHIISVQERGPDDPRNGISFCKRHHWAFDEGLFTLTDIRKVKVSPVVMTAERKKFDLEEYDGENVRLPNNEACFPAEAALHWHQENRFRS
jgi:predicted restriction endonuclease